MKTLIFLLVFIAFTGTSLKKAAFKVPGGNSSTTASSGKTIPEEVIKTYIDSRCSDDLKVRSSFTAEMPDDYLVAKKRGDYSILIPDIETPDGLRSSADAMRPVYHRWLNSEFPKMICDANLSFGRITDNQTSKDRAAITLDFQTLEGELGFSTTFHLIDSVSGWRIFDLTSSKERGVD